MKFDILQFDPCISAIDYYETKDSFDQAWEDCHRGDWMLWIAYRLGVNERKFFLAKARCAKTVFHLMNHEESRNAVEVAERYGLGTATIGELYAAAEAARYVAESPNYTSLEDSAFSEASLAAYAAVSSPYFSDGSAYYAASAIAYESNNFARLKENKIMTANICREILTEEVRKKIMGL